MPGFGPLGGTPLGGAQGSAVQQGGNISDVRDLMAEAHYNLAVMLGLKVDIYLDTSSVAPISGWSDLYALIRSMTTQEQKLNSTNNLRGEKVIEIARQPWPTPTFTGDELKPRKHRIKYGDVFWEIVSVMNDDMEIIANGLESAAVYTCMVRRMGPYVGGLAT
jgi:hypothetical protein